LHRGVGYVGYVGVLLLIQCCTAVGAVFAIMLDFSYTVSMMHNVGLVWCF
jgi:hypothetical protein